MSQDQDPRDAQDLPYSQLPTAPDQPTPHASGCPDQPAPVAACQGQMYDRPFGPQPPQGQTYEEQTRQGQAYQYQTYQGQTNQDQTYQGQTNQDQTYQGQICQGQKYTTAPGYELPPGQAGPTYTSLPRPVAYRGTIFRYFRANSLIEAYLMWFVLGLLGAHHFYLKRPRIGIVYLCTFGLAGCGYLVDLFRMPYLVSQANRSLAEPELRKKKDITDAYTLWFPFGLFGFHHFYLGNMGQGFLYLVTGGVFGVGWLIDIVRMPYMVRRANEPKDSLGLKNVDTAYMFAVSPLGIFGAQHMYLDRHIFGFLYLFTFGLLGIGWIVDWFRLPTLVKRANRRITQGPDNIKHLDEAYVLWFPLGWMGLHHFYLERYLWGVIYVFTFGLFGLGWWVDGGRMPWLVREFNQPSAERQRLPVHQIPPPSGVVIVTCSQDGRAAAPQAPDGGYTNPAYCSQQQPSQIVHCPAPQTCHTVDPSCMEPPPYSEKDDVTPLDGATGTTSAKD